jgi:hypothetical protein
MGMPEYVSEGRDGSDSAFSGWARQKRYVGKWVSVTRRIPAVAAINWSVPCRQEHSEPVAVGSPVEVIRVWR